MVFVDSSCDEGLKKTGLFTLSALHDVFSANRLLIVPPSLSAVDLGFQYSLPPFKIISEHCLSVFSFALYLNSLQSHLSLFYELVI